MTPEVLFEVVSKLSKQYGAICTQVVGEELLKAEYQYQAIHAVGRAGKVAPRLIELRWSPHSNEVTQYPKLTLIGKGVTFDTGGYDIKPSSGMLLMHKDMGGAAHVIGLMQLIMHHQLPIRLHVLIPAVENLVDSEAYRPSDVICLKEGTTVQITNTDAEGRLILADALIAAQEDVLDKPDLIIDMATLTGAMRVALGSDLPGYFTNDESFANAVQSEGLNVDPVWRMPLHLPYRSQIESEVADLKNAVLEGYGGAITAALFLEHFVQKHQNWVHFDLMAWNRSTQITGMPQGGEAMGLYQVFNVCKFRYSAVL